MKTNVAEELDETCDFDWSLIDLKDGIARKSTLAARAMGMSFEEFMLMALEEKLARLGDQ